MAELLILMEKNVILLRNHNVSSLPIDPHWVPYSQVKMAEEFLYFTLKLMTGKSRTNIYFIQQTEENS